MLERIKKIEERITKREQRIEKLQASLKEERNRLAKDKETLLHLKYDDVLKRMQEKGVSPDEALRAIDNEEKGQKEDNPNNSNNSEGVHSYA
ncbi:hypothetical protein [Bacillus pseudomycoides]|uniref:hypothetical protein n=1 Tax=Bacillus pseudomycoides TaxID=64104 RepID=UPI000BF0317A|nr:hypothetical protein [Bacillus pseudomycoides]MCR8860401.1 hypothetical protein [Bacillus pseudomycoides]PEK70461.1 hypothetical protein CN593_05440 [Bacillus pseudomycoides]PEN08545.1 hypothetical protein CN640_12950 [Bacillus pseudomycoides]PFW93945.1 hypothetical protein COL29_12485 [Bacillus pseudomycoides]